MTSQTSTSHILIVDDTVANLKILVSMLDQQGYDVRPINSAPLGLRAAQISKPDLILLDIQMPEMNGFEVCRQLKANEETRHIPVIFISALSDLEDKVKAFQAGGVDYITKPFQLEEVLARVSTHLEIQQLRKQDHLLITQQEQLIDELNAFAHTVAHDLKSPLAPIMGYSELLTSDEGDFDPVTEKQLLEKIYFMSRRMRDIIDSLLLLADIRQHRTLDTERIPMLVLVANVQERLQFQLEEVDATFITPTAEWPWVIGISGWIEEVWANYISNALKYGGRPCRIEIGYDFINVPDGMARFWVLDNGPGIPLEEQDKLFTPFTRLAQLSNIKGHGLGLSIVQRIMDKFGGSVGVECEGGQGSRFYFTLPLAEPE